MLIESLKAVNFRGFREILLPAVPERAVVSVVGEDPDVLRDVLSFALLGLPPETGRDVIRPGAGYCHAEVTLDLSGGRICLLRGVERTGRILASLRELESRRVLNRPSEVAARLAELLPVPRDDLTRHLLGGDPGSAAGGRRSPAGKGRAADRDRLKAECRARIEALRDRLEPEEERLRVAPGERVAEADPEELAGAGAALLDAIRNANRAERLDALRSEARGAAGMVRRAKRELEGSIARLESERRAVVRPQRPAPEPDERGLSGSPESRRGMERAIAALFGADDPRGAPAPSGAPEPESGKRRAAIDEEIGDLRRRRAKAVRLAGRIQGLRSRLSRERTLEFSESELPDGDEDPTAIDVLVPIEARMDGMEEETDGLLIAGPDDGPTPEAALRSLQGLGFSPPCAVGRDPAEIPPGALERELGGHLDRARRQRLREAGLRVVRSVAARRVREIRTELRIEEECLSGLAAGGDPEGGGILPDLVSFLSEGRYREIDVEEDGSLFGVNRNGRMTPVARESRLGRRVELARRLRAADAAIGGAFPGGRFAVIDAGQVPGPGDAADLDRLLDRVAPDVLQVIVLGPVEGVTGRVAVRLVATGAEGGRRLRPPSFGGLDLGRRGGAQGLGHGAADLG